jgi:uncharacterized protein (TIGR03435 family)
MQVALEPFKEIWENEQQTEGFNVGKGGRIMSDRVAHKFGYIRMLLVGLVALLSVAVPVLSAHENLTQSTVGSVAERQATLPQMAVDAKPGFDVATIKRTDPNISSGTFFTIRGSHIIAVNTNGNDLVSLAYGLHTKQIVNGPPWLLTARFDIDGTPDVEGRPNHDQVKLMIQKLLAARFKLAFHHEQRELAVYAIIIGNNGPKLTKTGRKPSDNTNFSYTNRVVLTVRNATMADFADGMQASFIDRPVVDQTGLAGRYDFLLRWTPDESQSGLGENVPPPADDPNAPPGLYTAIQEQLGLKLVPTKAPVDVLVIDHIEMPSEN